MNSTRYTQLSRSIRVAGSRRILTSMLRRLRHGTVTLHEGERRQTFGEPVEGVNAAELTVNDASFWPRVLTGGSSGLGESYFLGEWDSKDLTALLELLTKNLDRINRLSRIVAPVTALTKRSLRRFTPSRDGDRENIAAHYDVGNEFFGLFLDSTMAYSSAVFPSPTSSLEEASIEKFDRLCRKLSLGPRDHVVEIGTGWGGFAIHAARTYGCRVTSTTISAKQFEFATRRVAESELSDLVTVLDRDYRDLEGKFTHLVSIEMIEAVDWRLYETFFSACAKLLDLDGRAALQCIVIDDAEFERYKTRTDFIRRHIFPGGGLPSIAAITSALSRATDLRLVDLEDLGPHYVRTLNLWHERLAAKADDAHELGFYDEFLRKWYFYFAYCSAGFSERHVSVVQMVLARGDWRGSLQLRNT
ncbi:MAG: class I SAM-dependent methyltransferase [Acidobacteria bacterium]|nr:class I SAM-dependent methyltransferase [Acidobacteriota bacterium]